MHALYFLIVAEFFVVGWMWHGQPARLGEEHESDKSDPAVSFSRKRKEHRQSQKRADG
jgi:hypothetical protein